MVQADRKQAHPVKKRTVKFGKAKKRLTGGTFSGKVARNGNSNSLRLEMGFFAGHPLFNVGAELEATAIGEGTLLVRALNPAKPDDKSDPLICAFLDYLERDMMEHPETIQPIPQQELDEIAALVEGVDID